MNKKKVLRILKSGSRNEIIEILNKYYKGVNYYRKKVTTVGKLL